MDNFGREALWQERVSQWRDSGLSQRAFALQQSYPVRQMGYWERHLGKPSMVPLGGDRQVCNDRGAATGAVGSGRLEYDAVAEHFRQLAGRIAAQLVMQLLAASIWLATQPVDKAGGKALQS